MVRQSIIYLILSSLVVIFSHYVHLIIVYIDMLYTYINIQLASFFNLIGINAHGIASKTLLLAGIPLLITAIPALIYRLIKGRTMPYLIEIVWCIWLVVVLSSILIH